MNMGPSEGVRGGVRNADVEIRRLRRSFGAVDALKGVDLTIATGEFVALLGLILGLLSHAIGEAYPFFIVAAALLVWQRPRPEHFAARP